jgi:mannose-1-phosphate guanylyltransferase
VPALTVRRIARDRGALALYDERVKGPLCALLMAGGSGLRLWPLSRPERTKPFLARLGGTRSLLAETAARIAFVPPARQFVNVTRGLEALVRGELPELPEDHVIVAPEDRDTLPTLVFATARIAREYPDATLLLLASDNEIGDEAMFRAAIDRAATAAEAGPHLVSLGIKPTEASTRFGYMALGDPYPGLDETWFGTAYVEKPSAAIAAELFAGGRHDWNAGIFAWTIATFRRALDAYAPGAAEVFTRLCEAAGDDDEDALFRRLAPIAVDHGLLEHVPPSGGAARHVFVRGRFPWDDLGTFDALTKDLPVDAAGNVTTSGVTPRGCRGSMLVSEGSFAIEADGLDHACVIVSDAGDTLVAARRALGQIRSMLRERIRIAAPGDALVRELGARNVRVDADIPAVVGVIGVHDARVSIARGRVSVRATRDPGPRIFVATDDLEFARVGAELVVEALAKHGDREIFITVSAGKTPVDIHRELVERHAHALRWDRVCFVQMDEWAGVAPDDPRSFAHEMRTALVDPLGMRAIYIDGRAGPEPVLATEERVLAGGGFALGLHGIGTNGHIGFNEPPDDGTSAARRITLAESTRVASGARFGGAPPREGITLGLRSLGRANKTIVIARGAAKSDAIRAMLGEPSPACPASIVTSAPDLDVLVDRAAIAGHWSARRG